MPKGKWYWLAWKRLATCTWLRVLKYDSTEGTQEVWRLEEELDKDAVCHQFSSTCTVNTLPRKLWKGLETSKYKRKSFALWNMQMTLCYCLRKKRCYRIWLIHKLELEDAMEWEWMWKKKVTRISRQPFPVKIMIDQKQLENVESFKYLSSILTNDGRCTCEIKFRIAMAKAAFNNKRALLLAHWT